MTTLPAFPLSTAYLPGDIVSLRVFEDRYLAMVNKLADFDFSFLTVLISRGAEVGGGETRFSHGVMVRVDHLSTGPESLVLRGRSESAMTVIRWLPDDPYPRAEVEPQAESGLEQRDRFDVAATLSLLAQRIRTIVASMPSDGATSDRERRVSTIAAGRWWNDQIGDSELWRAFWIVAAAIPCGALDRSHLLEPGALTERVGRLKRIVDHVSEVVTFRFGQ